MLRARHILWLVALPLLGSATPAGEPVPKEPLFLSVRNDPGSARRFTVTSQGLHIFSRRGSDFHDGGTAPDTVQLVGTGSAELVSADSGKLLVLDVWVMGSDRPWPQRYTGRGFRIDRPSLTAAYVISNR